MSRLCKVRVRGSALVPFKYHVTFEWDESAVNLTPHLAADFYAEGDLAVYLEDFGAERLDISALLDTLENGPDGEIVVRPTEELLEVLWRAPAADA